MSGFVIQVPCEEQHRPNQSLPRALRTEKQTDKNCSQKVRICSPLSCQARLVKSRCFQLALHDGRTMQTSYDAIYTPIISNLVYFSSNSRRRRRTQKLEICNSVKNLSHVKIFKKTFFFRRNQPGGATCFTLRGGALNSILFLIFFVERGTLCTIVCRSIVAGDAGQRG